MQTITIEQAAKFFTISNLALDHLAWNGPRRGKAAQQDKPTDGRSIDLAYYRALEGVGAEAGDDPFDWAEPELKSWVKTIKQELRKGKGYCLSELAKLNLQVTK